MGELTGVFVADRAKIKALMGVQLYFGEVLGKHSEVYGEMEECAVEVLTEDQDFILAFEEILPKGVGYNPLDFIEEDEYEDE